MTDAKQQTNHSPLLEIICGEVPVVQRNMVKIGHSLRNRCGNARHPAANAVKRHQRMAGSDDAMERK
jgi:hypothetical protein